eukprot:709949-Lingulodinium_polyedra.AAC.1
MHAVAEPVLAPAHELVAGRVVRVLRGQPVSGLDESQPPAQELDPLESRQVQLVVAREGL